MRWRGAILPGMSALTTPNTQRKPRAIDLFAGCGGMTQGLKQAGFMVVGAVELDPSACRVYRQNHPKTRLWKMDIARLTGPEISKALGIPVGELDLLGGCPPCQGFSTLRTKNGKRRPREKQNDLIFEFLRLVRSLRPKQIMLENVPALYRNKRFRDFKRALRSSGYVVKASILNVVDYGVPQKRRRVVLLASRVSRVGFAAPLERHRTVREAIGHLGRAGASGDALHDLPESRSKEVRELIRSIPPNGGSRDSLPPEKRLACHKRSDGFKDVYGRMRWDRPAPTITTGCFNPSKGRFLHPKAHRGVTMREAALLQGFPADYKFPVNLGRVRLATMIGNALPPAFVASHADQLRRQLRPTTDVRRR